MNLAQLQAWAARNRTVLLAGGAAAVGGAALYARRGGGVAGEANYPQAEDETGYPQHFTGQGYWDSGPYDIYDALEEQISDLERRVDEKTPKPKKKPKPKRDRGKRMTWPGRDWRRPGRLRRRRLEPIRPIRTRRVPLPKPGPRPAKGKPRPRPRGGSER